MRQVILLGLVLLLASCGGAKRTKSPGVARSASISHGPISKACISSDRKARSSQLCGCIQAVADQTLSRAYQRRAVQFYTDPHMAQLVRQSDQPANEEFWQSYKAYSEKAKQTCR